MANRSKWTQTLEEKLFEAIVIFGGNVSRASESLNLARTTVYTWCQTHDGFRERMADAIDKGVDVLEDEARRRAFDGVDEPVFYQGDECGVIRRYSDMLMGLLLRGHRSRYRQSSHEITGKDGAPLAGPSIVLYLPTKDKPDGAA